MRVQGQAGSAGEAVVFTYSNGDVYEGEMRGGERHGWGRLVYCGGGE
jgi:hypothetical protein